MLLDELRPFDEVDLPICLDEIVTDGMNVIYDHKLDVFLLNSLGEVKEDLVIVLNVLAEVHDDVLPDCLLGHCRLVLNQKVLLHLVETLLIQVLACDHKEGLAFQPSLLDW